MSTYGSGRYFRFEGNFLGMLGPTTWHNKVFGVDAKGIRANVRVWDKNQNSDCGENHCGRWEPYAFTDADPDSLWKVGDVMIRALDGHWLMGSDLQPFYAPMDGELRVTFISSFKMQYVCTLDGHGTVQSGAVHAEYHSVPTTCTFPNVRRLRSSVASDRMHLE